MKIIATAVLTLSLALTVGCGQTPSGTPKKAANAAGATASDWDHNGNWSSPEIHGKAFFESTASERKSCLHCHNGTTSGYNTGPKCTSCHANFPHNENWMDHSNHGKTFLTSNDLDKGKCLSCHTATKPRSGVSCSDCHDQFPAMHTDDFKAGEHGVVVRHSSSESCVSCHTATIQDLPKLSNIACATCHSGAFPHGEKWGEHSNHGKTFLTSKDSEKADCLGDQVVIGRNWMSKLSQ